MVKIGFIDLEIFLTECEGELILCCDEKEKIIGVEEFKRLYNTENFKELYYIDCNETRMLLVDKNNTEIIIEML